MSAERIADIIDRWKLLPSKNGGPRADSLELAGMILAEGEITAAMDNQFADPKREELLRLAGELAVAAEGIRATTATTRQPNGIYVHAGWDSRPAELTPEQWAKAHVSVAAAIIAEVDRVSGAPKVSAANLAPALSALTDFVELLTDANGPYKYLDGTTVVQDAYRFLSAHKGAIVVARGH